MQMITIRDFKKGESCYVLNMHTGRNREPEIKERLVKTVGKNMSLLIPPMRKNTKQ